MNIYSSIVLRFASAVMFFSSLSASAQSYTIYYQNFDTDAGNWVSSTTLLYNGNWSRGTTPIVGEGSYWRTNPYAAYTKNSRTYLTGPAISTSGFTNVRFYVDIKYNTEANADGLNIEYTTDITGLTGWTRLGSNGQGTNWYNSTNVTGLGTNAHGWSGQNAEVAASPSKFIEASIDASSVPALNNKAALRFRFFFADNNNTTLDEGVAIDNVIIKGDYITAPANPAFGPGSITSNLKLWLKSNAGTTSTTDGSDVKTWTDQAYNNDAVSYGTFMPTYRNSSTRNINFNPVIDFSRANSDLMKGKGGFNSQDYYVVVKTNSQVDKTTNNSMVMISGKVTSDNFGQDGTCLGFGKISSRFNNNTLIEHMIGYYNQSNASNAQGQEDSYGRAYNSTTVNSVGESVMILNVKSNTAVTPNVTEIYLNGKRIDNMTGVTGTNGTGNPLMFSEFSNSIYQLGVGRFTLNGFLVNGSVFNTYLDGRMTEMFSYATARTAADQQKIQSYLAIKNGVTLHAAGSTTADNLSDVNYVNSAGAITWNTAENPAYNYDIAGIGRDDAAQLNQKQSKSENPGTVMTIGLGTIADTNTANTNTFATDKSYLIWGSNGQSIATTGAPINVFLGPDIVTTITDVSLRKWKLTETGGDVGTTLVSIPASALANLPPLAGNDAYVMVVASNSSFTSGLETVFLRTNGLNLQCSYDFDGTKYITFGVAHETIQPRHATFDGIDDYIRVTNNADNNLNNTFSIQVWVRPTTSTGADKTVVSKSDGLNGYKLLVLNDNRVRFQFDVLGLPQSITSTAALPYGKWHNIAVINNGSNIRIYIDGILNGQANALTPAVSTNTFCIGAEYRSKTNIVNYFRGDIDELRIFNVAIPVGGLQYLMNQEMAQNGTGIKGSVMPLVVTKNDIANMTWASVTAYYSMNSYIGTHLNDDSQYDNRGSLVVPDNFQIKTQTAPLPYDSTTSGDWSGNGTWKDGDVNEIPNSLSIVDNATPVDWNIVRTYHNVASSSNHTVLGLMVLNNKLSALNDSKLQVSHYLKLMGKIDLTGQSQLVQTDGSDLDVTSSGLLERDQQGTKNSFNYNYWSSPVSTINTTSNNNGYTVGGVMKDGTSAANPAAINFANAYYGAATSPITIGNYWIYKFQNLSNAYANWTYVGSAGTLGSGQGYTMKGAGASSATQNYVFTGKPNNGTITIPVAANNLNLSGNPYPSALDATQFIKDNISGSNANPGASGAINGNLYFWEHNPANNSHVLANYMGGYSTKNLTSYVPAVAGSGTAGLGAGTYKTPKQFIPVGQGFFVQGSTTGGQITYKNSQRNFVKENELASNYMFRSAESSTTVEEEKCTIIKLGFNSVDHYHRQIALGFMNAHATDGFDLGYDAPKNDGNPSDMFFVLGTDKLVIQGVGYFNPMASYPLSVKSEVSGTVKIELDESENLADNQAVYLYDDLTGTYYNLHETHADLNVDAGTYDNRFYIRFIQANTNVLGTETNMLDESIKMVYTHNNNTLTINNMATNNRLTAVQVYNLVGQQVAAFDVRDIDQQNITLQLTRMSAGAYIVKGIGEKGNISRKIVVR